MAFTLPENMRPLYEVDLDNPDFEGAERVHDWRNHVPEEVKAQWYQLGLEAKQVAYLAAYNEAEREEWD